MAEAAYEFGPFRLDPAEHRLLRDNAPVPLAPKAFELLVALISNHGHLVTRESLMHAVWPDSFVEETNLTVNISLLRKILGDTPEGHPWIATVPKRGYRFDGAVTLLRPPESPAPELPPPAPGPAPRAAVLPEPGLAVSLPPQPAGTLAGARRFRLAATFAGVFTIALLIWIGYRVLASHNPSHASTISLAPASADQTQNPQAHALYLEGRANWNKRSLESVRSSIDEFRQATNLDPNYAAAWSGLADAWILAGSYGNSFLSPADAMPKAKQAAERALAIDDSSAEAHTSLAYIHLMWDWDFSGAEREFKRALAINPNYVTAHHWYSHELAALGRMAESHEQSELALGLDPTNVVINEHMAWHHMMAREYDRSIPQAKKAVELDPSFVQAHRVLALDLLYTGKSKEACAEFEKGVELSHGDPVATAYLARCYALTHREPEARKLLADLEQASAERYVSAAEIAAVYAALNDQAAALKWLAKGCDEHAGSMIYLNADRVWDPLRANPAFLAIVRRVNLPVMADETLSSH